MPEQWTQLAIDILAQKYFRKAGIPQVGPDRQALLDAGRKPVLGGERDARQVFNRLGRLLDPLGQDAWIFQLRRTMHQPSTTKCAHMLARQMAAPNSPQWFNTGLHWAYGISGPAQGHYYVDPEDREMVKATNAYEHPQPHACFIQSVDDDLVNEGGIMDLWTREARLFKYGSGTGTNFSKLRGEDEPLSGGGRSSGLMSFLKIGDRAAGAIKSGGTTRARRQDGLPRPRPPGHRGVHQLEGGRGAESRGHGDRLEDLRAAAECRAQGLPCRRRARSGQK